MATLALGTGARLWAQEEPMAILVRGPIPVTGLPGMGPNALSGHFGLYEYGQAQVRVYFTREPTTEFAAWEPVGCGGETLHRMAEDDSNGYYYRRSDAWTVLLFFSDDVDSPCPFFTQFLNRFLYFLGVSESKTVVPLPAVLRSPAS